MSTYNEHTKAYEFTDNELWTLIPKTCAFSDSEIERMLAERNSSYNYAVERINNILRQTGLTPEQLLKTTPEQLRAMSPNRKR